ncbi:zf-HC2 domain-containing protein [Flexivirga oryzae]|uniref:Anti-sigma factor RsiW n=1 Tax=Flexivirga oryzae TaxID=1794944 RepID=A0A839N9K3_9MICO|nr:zf-HC2 domain-containing protein [Flexivirga oryzae]MBB2894458.1 anti-sigma factor RsiW [Flexivirga oryzae]
MMLFSRDFARAEHEHLGDRVGEYVDGMLDADDEYRADLHLTVCEHCRYAVQQERAIIAQLRSVSFDSGGHEQLMAGLLSLASSESGAPLGASSQLSKDLDRPAPAVVTCSAPPQYQSARKSMAFALFAVAGCVGVALVASTASGVAQGPQSPSRQAPGQAALVRDVSTPQVSETAKKRETSGGSTRETVPMFVQVAANPTP